MAYNLVTFGIEEQDVVGFTPDQRTALELHLTTSIAFEANQLYRNYEYPRYKNFYGYCQVMSGAFVVKSVPIAYLNQEILHWRDDTFGINQTTGCYARAIGAALPTPINLVANTVKVRQRYTSVRFKLREGVKCNVNLTWETGEPKCADNILEPDAQQGRPASPNNQGYNPGARPPSQGGDNSDPTANDGADDPNDPSDDPPKPLLPGIGQWYGHAVFSDGYVTNSPTGETNPSLVWTSPNICHEGVDGRVAPPGIQGRSVYLNGQFLFCAQDPSHGTVTSVYFDYH